MIIPYFDEIDSDIRKLYIEEELKKESSLKKILGSDMNFIKNEMKITFKDFFIRTMKKNNIKYALLLANSTQILIRLFLKN